MDKIARVLHDVERASGNEKQEVLRQAADTVGLKDVLYFIYNPYVKTGISKIKLAKVLEVAKRVDATALISHWGIMDYLRKHNTGSHASILRSAQFIKATTKLFPNNPLVLNLAKAILAQDLKIGVSSTTLNKVYGSSFIPKIGCMLGVSANNVGRIKWPCVITEKLDGVRRILIKENGLCKFYSRSGREDTGLIEIEEDAKYLPDNTAYDGELLAVGSYVDSIEARQATNSIASSKGEKTGLMFNIFDMIPIAEFKAGKSKMNAFDRKVLLGATLMDESISVLDEKWHKLIQGFGIHRELNRIRPVPILDVANSIEEVTPIVSYIWQLGGEGVMLNTNNAYEIKRSKSLIKVKYVESMQLKTVDMLEGQGKYEGMLGALIVEYRGSRIGVGSGFADSQRLYIWENQEKFIGTLVEIDTFGESKNAQGYVSLNCPIFKRFVSGGDKA